MVNQSPIPRRKTKIPNLKPQSVPNHVVKNDPHNTSAQNDMNRAPERATAVTNIAVIGLGYVGLPLALQFARSGARVIGIDIDPSKTHACA